MKFQIMAMDFARRGQTLDVEIHFEADRDDPVRMIVDGEPYGLSPQGNRGRTDR